MARQARKSHGFAGELRTFFAEHAAARQLTTTEIAEHFGVTNDRVVKAVSNVIYNDKKAARRPTIKRLGPGRFRYNGTSDERRGASRLEAPEFSLVGKTREGNLVIQNGDGSLYMALPIQLDMSEG